MNTYGRAESVLRTHNRMWNPGTTNTAKYLFILLVVIHFEFFFFSIFQFFPGCVDFRSLRACDSNQYDNARGTVKSLHTAASSKKPTSIGEKNKNKGPIGKST